jgi:hypothetical protein
MCLKVLAKGNKGYMNQSGKLYLYSLLNDEFIAKSRRQRY